MYTTVGEFADPDDPVGAGQVLVEDAGEAHALADMVRTDTYHQLCTVAGDTDQAEAIKVVARSEALELLVAAPDLGHGGGAVAQPDRRGAQSGPGRHEGFQVGAADSGVGGLDGD